MIAEEINRMAGEWWETLTSVTRKAQERKQIDSAADARGISFDLNGILMAAYWTYLVEKDNEVFREARSAVLAKLEGLATPRVPASAFKSENAWKEYVKERHAEERKKSGSIFPRLGGKKPLPSVLSRSIPSLSDQPPKKSESVLHNLRKLTKS